MTQGARISDAVRRGMGRAAMAIGAWCDAYRPTGAGSPLDVANRFLRLQAAFAPAAGKVPAFGATAWIGTFDAAYTRVGDFIVRPRSSADVPDGGIWFIAAQEPMQPVLCVRAARMIDILRPAGAAQLGVNGYGGVAREAAEPVLTQWPASLVSAGAGGPGVGLPSGAPSGGWQILLPSTAGVVLRNGDIVVDDLGRNAVIGSAELTAMGWRLQARQANT